MAKGDYISFFIDGIAIDDVNVKAIRIAAIWDGTQLYTNDFPPDEA